MKRIVYAILLLSLVFAAGCGGDRQVPLPVDDAALSPAPWDPAVAYWEKDGLNWDAYSKLNIKRMEVILHDDIDEGEFFPGVADDISLLTTRRVTEKLTPLVTVTEWPGPSSLMMDLTMTGVKHAGEPLNKINREQLPQPIDLSEAAVTVRIFGPEQEAVFAVLRFDVAADRLELMDELDTVIESVAATIERACVNHITFRRP